MDLHVLKQEAAQELQCILDYWQAHAVDNIQGGIVGRIDNQGRVYAEADKGLVLHARALWTFAAAAGLLQQEPLQQQAHCLFGYINRYFIDVQHGGVYWCIDYRGQPVAAKKQAYAQAFAIYAFSAYYKLVAMEAAKEQAIALYRLLQQYSYDQQMGGYLEAFTVSWQPLEDVRLSDKDANEKKTANTHLHILEAYTALYQIWPDAALANSIRHLLDVFLDHIIDPHTGHLQLFFTERWEPQESLISFGHDIEAGWLLLEAATVLGDAALINRLQATALVLTDAALEGMDKDGGLWYECQVAEQQWRYEKHWWPQAEALVGLINAWQVSGKVTYAAQAMRCWRFIQQYILDKQRGEWFWGVTSNYTVMNADKAGFWKCPYHNARACMEIMKRIP
jgi:cellobiose epimerase